MEPGADVVVLVCPDGRQLQCSIAMLSQHSKVLRDCFSQGNYAGQRLPVQGVDSGSLAAVVTAMYSGECHVDVQTVCGIYDAASKLQCQLLQDKCLQFIQATVSPDNTLTLYSSAKAVHCTSLVDMLLEFIVARLPEVSTSLDFLRQSYEVASEVLLHAATKQQGVVVVRAAAAWLVHERSREGLFKAKLLELIGVPATASQLVESIIAEARQHAEDARDQVHKLGQQLTALPGLPLKAEPSSTAPNALSILQQQPPMGALGPMGAHGAMGPGSGAMSGLPLTHLDGVPFMALPNGGLTSLAAMPIMQMLPNGQLQAMMPQGPGSGLQGLQGLQAMPGAHMAGNTGNTGGDSSAGSHKISTLLGVPPGMPMAMLPGGLLGVPGPNGPGFMGETARPYAGSEPTRRGSDQEPDSQQSWHGLDGVLALAEAAEREAERERGTGGGYRRASTFPFAPHDPPSAGSPRVGATTSQTKRKGGAAGAHHAEASSISASLPLSKLQGAAAVSAANSKRRRPSHAVTPLPVVGFPVDAHTAPGRLFDATPATSLSTSLLTIGALENAPSTGTTLSAPPTSSMPAVKHEGEPGRQLSNNYEALTQLLAAGAQVQAAAAGNTPWVGSSASPEPDSITSVGPGSGTNGSSNGGAPNAAAIAALANLSGLRAVGSDADASREALMRTLMGLSVAGGPSLSHQAAMEPRVPGGGSRMQRLPRPPPVRGICHVDNCYADLTNLRDYHLRYKICDYHLKATSIMRDGIPQRFCQQCGRFHPLDAFDGTRRSCRAMLQRHNARRAKKAQEGASGNA